MRGQTLTDTQLLLELVGEAYGFEDLAQFRHGILEIITRLVPCDRVGYNEITPDQTFAITVPEFDPSLTPKIAGLIYENPLIERFERTRDGRPYRISDLIDQPTFHRLALYQEFYRQIGIEWQVAFTLPARAPLIVGIALTRTHTDFTDREVGLLALARPHLMQAYRNAELCSARTAMLAALEQGLGTLGQQIIVLDPHGRVEFATDSARRLLGDTTANPRGLPNPVRAWITDHRDTPAAVKPLLLHTASGTVLVRLLPTKRTDRREVLLLQRWHEQVGVRPGR
jgi:GAF domain-containing protein